MIWTLTPSTTPTLVALISEKTPRREINLAELQEKLNAAMQKLV